MSNITVGLGIPMDLLNREPESALQPVASRTRDALVLSAGGLFAAYQAGVYKALWPYWRPDVVVGASAGALNGWLIAAGVTPDELIAQWLDPDAGAVVKFRERPSLWKGCFDPQPLLERTRMMQRNFARKLPLSVVSIEVPKFRPLLFCDDEITAEHLVASCSIPLLYPTARVNGLRLLDGGLFEPTPIWAAATMGATRVIAINALPRLTPWPVRMILSGMHRARKMPVPDTLEVFVITPSGRIGGARQAVMWEHANIRRWIEMGIGDGEYFLTQREADFGQPALPFAD